MFKLDFRSWLDLEDNFILLRVCKTQGTIPAAEKIYKQNDSIILGQKSFFHLRGSFFTARPGAELPDVQ
jgi:hypothetical protein